MQTSSNPFATVVQTPGTTATPEAVRLALALPRNQFSDEDVAAVSRLPVRAREDMMRWHRLLEGLMPVSGRVRVKGVQTLLERISRREGVSVPTVRRAYDAFRKMGWRGLVNRSLAGPLWYDRNVVTKLTVAERPAFLDFWRGLMEQYQGRDQTGKAAHRALARRLEAWERGDSDSRIPGYDLPPARDPFTHLPTGWSYDNLMAHKSPEAELMAAKYGRGALADFRLPVLSTRQGLKVGQVVFFDDQDYDVRTNFVGVARRSFRPCGFDAQDCLSAKQPLHGYKPVLVDDATGKRKKLTETDFMWFVVAYLTTVGYRRDTGTTFIVEHGTAAIRAEFEDRIFKATQGKVVVDRGGIAGQPAYAGMFEGQPRGNFKSKARLESARVILRNEMAALPGAVGKDRDHAPEGDYGLDRYNQKLLNALSQLPAHLAARLQFPILDWREFLEVVTGIYGVLDARTDHELEGWERCGHICHEYRLALDTQHWMDAASNFARMDEAQRQAIVAQVATTPGLWRTRFMSPAEVWDAGKHELVTVPDNALPILMGAVGVRVGERCEKNGLFLVEDKEIGGEPLSFDASHLVKMLRVEPGQKYSVYLNPFAPQRLVVCDAQLRYLGTAIFWDRSGQLDHAAVARKIAHGRAQEAPSLENLSRRGSKQNRRMVEMREANAAALTGRAAPRSDASAPSAPRPMRRAEVIANPADLDAAILQAAEDAALIDGDTPALVPTLSLPAARRHQPTPKSKSEEAEGSDLDLL